MSSACVQSFLYASEDKPLLLWMMKRNSTSHRKKGHWSQGYVPRKKHSQTSARELKNHSEQRIDSKLIPNRSVIIEVSRLCLPGLNAAAEMNRAFSSFFLLQGVLTSIPMAMEIPAPLRKPCYASLSSTESWETADGSPKRPTVRTGRKQRHERGSLDPGPPQQREKGSP